MEETAVVSMEFVLVALIALAVLLGIVWYGVTSRTREFDRRITKLEEENAKPFLPFCSFPWKEGWACCQR